MAQSSKVSRPSPGPALAQRSLKAGLRRPVARAPAIIVAGATEKIVKEFVPPPLNPEWPSPIFGGSTGGLLRKAQVEEFYVLTWESKKEQIFEMPTGGAAIMRSGPNLLKLARKEQCLALLTQLRNKFKCNGCVYRVFPSGEVQYLHPKDGVYPEKVNAGRVAVNNPDRRIGQNPEPVTIKFLDQPLGPEGGAGWIAAGRPANVPNSALDKPLPGKST